MVDNSFHIESGCKKIAFIDLGANRGDISKSFFEFHRVLFGLGKIELHVHAFEPGKVPAGTRHPLRQSLKTINDRVARHGGTVTLHSKAAWVNDGITKLSVGKKFMNTNSAITSVVELVKASSHNFKGSVNVESIDFSKWIQALVANNDYDRVYVKMNIEGSEYPIIDKMIKDNTLSCIDKLFIEFHKRYPHISKDDTEDDYVEKIHTATSKTLVYRSTTDAPARHRVPGSVAAHYEYVPRFGWASPLRKRPFLLGFTK